MDKDPNARPFYRSLYFPVITAIILGVGMNIDATTLDTRSISAYTGPGKMASTTDFLLGVIPSTVVDAFAKGEILQLLLIAVMFGFALHRFGGRGTLVFDFIEKFSHVLFTIVGHIMKVAPIGAFGAMAFTIGKYGLGSLVSLGALMATFYATCLLFIFAVLGSIARVNGFSIWKFIKYIKEELMIVLGTSSSEAALPRMMVVTGNGFIVPAATLSAVGHVPVAGRALILGIDRFMSEARALTNLIGTGVATIVVAKWSGDLDQEQLQRELDHPSAAESDEPEAVLDATPQHMPATAVRRGGPP